MWKYLLSDVTYNYRNHNLKGISGFPHEWLWPQVIVMGNKQKTKVSKHGKNPSWEESNSTFQFSVNPQGTDIFFEVGKLFCLSVFEFHLIYSDTFLCFCQSYVILGLG